MLLARAGDAGGRRHQMSTVAGWLYLAGGIVTVVVIAIPDRPDGYRYAVQIGLATASIVSGGALVLWKEALPVWAFHPLVISGVGFISVGVGFGGDLGGSVAMFYAWTGAFVFTFFTWRQAVAYTAYVAVAYTLAMAAGDHFPYPAGRVLYALATMAAIGSVLRWLVDQLRRAQAELADLNATLEQRVRQQVVQIERYMENIRSSRKRLVTTQDAERRRLERDLHDGAQQEVVALKIRLALISRFLDAGAVDEARSGIRDAADAVDQVVESLRDTAHGIYPPLLASDGLGRALSAQTRRAGIHVTLEADEVGRFAADVEGAVYYSCLEALQNVMKYAQAEHVTVRLAYDGARLCFSVIDDGRGFDVERTARGHGLTNLDDRLAALGGQLDVVSAVSRGTTVSGVVPAERMPSDHGGLAPTPR